MSNQELFSEPEEPELTPEQRVAQNERLKAIDIEMGNKALAAFMVQENGPDAFEEERNVRVARMTHKVPFLAERMLVELDPDLTLAHNYTVTRFSSRPSRLPFTKKETPVIEQVELASWILPVMTNTYAGIILGNDGALYGFSIEESGASDFKAIELKNLSFEDIKSIEDTLDDYIEIRETIARHRNRIS